MPKWTARLVASIAATVLLMVGALLPADAHKKRPPNGKQDQATVQVVTQAKASPAKRPPNG